MIESNAWLVPMIFGLCLDICGVVILAGPLLQGYFNYSLPKNVWGTRIPPNPMKSKLDFIENHIDVLEMKLMNLVMSDSVERDILQKNVRVSLIIITTGFILQIVGNIMR